MDRDCGAGCPKTACIVESASCKWNASILNLTVVNLGAYREEILEEMNAAAAHWSLANAGVIIAGASSGDETTARERVPKPPTSKDGDECNEP